jgi:TolB-like protein/DNA-binding winged helix-turn-helix (wHTH) protein/Flp pilus assembly protein TadD
MPSPRHISLVRFGMYEVSFQSGELRKAGMKIKIQQQPLKLLEVLLEKPGEVVTREELRTRIWPIESFGDFDQALNIAISKLRTALGDPAENSRFIETIPKRGYRFIAEVSMVAAAVGTSRAESHTEALPLGEASQPTPQEAIAPLPRRSSVLLVGVALAFTLSLALLAGWLMRSRHQASSPIRSLAVLPLDNFSGDPSQDYFADGMTDELTTSLARISALRVISRTSVMRYRGARKPLPEIARELHVDAVVEGSVRRVGDQVLITAQLIQAPDDKHLWADSFEGNVGDSLALQNQLARAIAEQIKVEVTPQEQAILKKASVVNPDAYKAYLKGRYFWNKRTADGLKAGLAYFNEAIEKDPTYAEAYSGLADTYALLGDWEYGVMTPADAMPKAKAAARRALELDDTLSEAHASLGFCLDGFDWDLAAGDREFKRAIQLNPGYATAHHWYAWHLILLGRNAEAVEEMRKAENLDPLSLIINSDLAELLLIAGLPDESLQQSRRTIEMEPGFALAHNQLGQAYLEKHMLPAAINALQKAVRLSGGSQTCVANLARAYAASNRKPEAIDLLNDLKKRSTHPHAPEIAMIYAALGDNGQAMVWLEKAYQERLNPGVLLRPGFNSLRQDPHFQELRKRIGLTP